ncbi:uncharacterized protein LOC126736014 [Anthonomus grandis grandis]|uniref:uncharacterized protein LOC126736014 n=1 Tax=Anthonomus grandis grandis TaxID=2921223 RepID=UPI0021650758|nr:uncharacterized protein LOC126736014 [Anthonomus grandis grandis]
MRIFGVAFSVFCVLIVANCGEPSPHHIDQRILENQDGLNYTLTENDNFTYNTNNLITVEPAINSSVIVTSTPSTDEDVSTDVTRMHVNITALLRNKDNPVNVIPKNLNQNISLLMNITNNETTANSALAVDPKAIDTEVNDLLNHNSQESPENQGPLYEKQQHPVESLEPVHFSDNIDTETELIEDGENTEDELRKIKNYKIDAEDRLPAVPLAVILVSIFVTLSVLSYAGLLLWRKYLEDRYGSRTLLVDAEEFADSGDLKHFTI